MRFFQFIKRNLCWGIVTPKTGRLGRLYTFECTWALSTNFCHHTVVLSPQPKGTRGNFDKWKRRRKKIIKYLLKVFKSTTNEISLGIMWEGIRFSLNRFFFNDITLCYGRGMLQQLIQGTKPNSKWNAHKACVFSFLLNGEERKK